MFDDFTLTRFVIWFNWLVDSSIVGGLFMSKKNIYDQKHLTTSQRIHIEKGLNDGLSFAAIARKLEKHPSTIAKEVKKYRSFQNHEVDTRHPLRCARFKECSLRFLCDKPNCV